MLKINDNKDLKELENFGLKPRYSEMTGQIDRYVYEYKDFNTYKTGLKISRISLKDNKYQWEITLITIEGLDKLYELISNGFFVTV